MTPASSLIGKLQRLIPVSHNETNSKDLSNKLSRASKRGGVKTTHRVEGRWGVKLYNLMDRQGGRSGRVLNHHSEAHGSLGQPYAQYDTPSGWLIFYNKSRQVSLFISSGNAFASFKPSPALHLHVLKGLSEKLKVKS